MTLFDINKAEAASKAVEMYRDQRPTRHPKLTLRQCAERCNAHYSLARKYNARYQKGQRIPGFQRVGRQPTLSDQEEQALHQFVTLVTRGLFPLTSACLISYGDYLRAKRPAPPAMPLTYRWATKWRRDNPQLMENGMNYVDSYRMAAAGVDFEGVRDWFGKYGAVLDKFEIAPENLWSFDESPFFVGFVDGALTALVIRNKKKKPRVIFSPSDKETLKAVDSISAAGVSIPSFLIWKADALPEDDVAASASATATASVEEDDGMVITKTDIGYYNAKKALAWAQHFNRHSFERSPSFDGTIEEWFGYPASVDPNDGDPRIALAGTGRSRSTPVYRALIMDSFNAHEKPVILLYCEYFDIIPITLPPSPRFQPFDIELYKRLKVAQRGNITRATQQDQHPFSRHAFLKEWRSMHKCIFARAHIHEAFKSSGLWPIDATQAVDRIKDEQFRLRKEREIPAFTTIEGSYYLTNAGRAEILVTDPILEMRLSLAHRWRACKTDEDRWHAIRSLTALITEVPEVADWVGKQPVEVRRAAMEVEQGYLESDVEASDGEEDVDVDADVDAEREGDEDESRFLSTGNSDMLPGPDVDLQQ